MAFYIPLLAASASNVVMMKATSSPETGGSWANVGGSVFVTVPSCPIKSMWAFEHSSDFYVATQTSDGRVRLHIFDPGTDAWTTENEVVADVGDHADFDSAPNVAGVSIALRSDADIVVAFTGQDDGSSVDHVLVRIRTVSTWGSFLSPLTNASRNPVLIGPDTSDRITLVAREVSADLVTTRSVDSGSTFGTQTTVAATADTADFIVAPGVLYQQTF